MRERKNPGQIALAGVFYPPHRGRLLVGECVDRTVPAADVQIKVLSCEAPRLSPVVAGFLKNSPGCYPEAVW